MQGISFLVTNFVKQNFWDNEILRKEETVSDLKNITREQQENKKLFFDMGRISSFVKKVFFLRSSNDLCSEMTILDFFKFTTLQPHSISPLQRDERYPSTNSSYDGQVFNKGTFTVPNLALTDSGKYSCCVEEDGRLIKSSGFININVIGLC